MAPASVTTALELLSKLCIIFPSPASLFHEICEHALLATYFVHKRYFVIWSLVCRKNIRKSEDGVDILLLRSVVRFPFNLRVPAGAGNPGSFVLSEADHLSLCGARR
jgi:hypothetical protein